MLESSPPSPTQPSHDGDDEGYDDISAVATAAITAAGDGVDVDDDDDNGYETDEELYAIVDIKDFEGASFDMQQLGEWSITGIELPQDSDDHDSDDQRIIMKLGESMLFRGHVDELVGTALCFEQTQQDERDSPPSLQYSYSTNKVIHMERLYAKPKQTLHSNPVDLDQSSGGSEQSK